MAEQGRWITTDNGARVFLKDGETVQQHFNNPIKLTKTVNNDDEEIKGRGYVGHSMSVNAQQAYEAGEKPESKWDKKSMMEEILNYAEENGIKVDKDALSSLTKEEMFRHFFTPTSYHHTGKFFNRTNFYKLKEFEEFSRHTADSIKRDSLERKEKRAAAEERRKAEAEASKQREKLHEQYVTERSQYKPDKDVEKVLESWKAKIGNDGRIESKATLREKMEARRRGYSSSYIEENLDTVYQHDKDKTYYRKGRYLDSFSQREYNIDPSEFYKIGENRIVTEEKDGHFTRYVVETWNGKKWTR